MDKRAQSIKMKSGLISAIKGAENLEDQKVLAIQFLNKKAGAVRGQYITITPGQDAVYLSKVEEAKAYQRAEAAGQVIDEGDYPHLSGEVGITATDLSGVASVVLAKRNEWIAVSANIESQRLGATKSIRAAATLEQVFAAIKVSWPNPSLM